MTNPAFTDVKSAVSVPAILEHYSVLDKMTKKPDGGLRGPCPFHNSQSNRSFHVTPSGRGYKCFGCDRGGNVLDFVAETEDVSIREASQLIARWFSVQPEGVSADVDEPAEDAPSPDEEDLATDGRLNAPLHFPGLRNLETSHPALEALQIPPETAQALEGGFCTKGLMKDRVAIPIHNRDGELVGYAGFDPETETYRHPQNLYPWMVVFNLHRQEKGSALVVVTTYLDAWRLHVAGVQNVVCLLDGRLSRHQEQILEEFGPDRLLLLQTTNRDLYSIGERLSDRFFVRHEVAPADADLTQYGVDGLS